ncbi:MAG: beta-N-acetylhexosaminidase [Gammaproteobacteria bacterium]
MMKTAAPKNNKPKTAGAGFGGRLMIGVEGLEKPNAADAERLRHPAVGGVILFARNFADGAQLRRLTANIRRAASRRILIAADQEGGRVQRFCGGEFVQLPAAAKYADSAKAEAGGMVMAAQLLAAGVDFSFAPVLDVRGKSKVIGMRAFAAAPDDVFDMASAFARGMHRAGMHCCGKHFPGHGNVAADSHKTLPVDGRAFEDIVKCDLLPFAKWAKAKTPFALMTAHIVYPKCDVAAATFSSFWLRRVLRRRLGFGGLVISDDLSMGGANVGTIGERMNRARDAGCDLLLICGREDIDNALSAAKTNKTTKTNPWLQLAPLPDAEVQLNSPEYYRALKQLPR